MRDLLPDNVSRLAFDSGAANHDYLRSQYGALEYIAPFPSRNADITSDL